MSEAALLREAATTIRDEWEPKRGSAWSTCIGRPELFESTHPADHHEARELCAVCPMLEACDTLRHEIQASVPAGYRSYAGPSGTWAGKLVGGKGVAACGTDSGYFRHRRLSETPCDGCRAAHASAHRRRRARKAS